MSFTQRKSEFEKWIPADRPAIHRKWLLWIFFPAQIVSGCKEWPECDYWIYVFKLKHFVRHDYNKFDDRILHIPGAEFCHSVAHVCLQTSNLASFTVEIAAKFLSLMSKIIEMKSHVVKSKGGQRNAILTGPLYFRGNSQLRNGNSDDKVLTIALRYTAASVFRKGDSLTPFRDSISVFQCRSARLTASRSFGYLS